jgi:hypothetical protein
MPRICAGTVQGADDVFKPAYQYVQESSPNCAMVAQCVDADAILASQKRAFL